MRCNYQFFQHLVEESFASPTSLQQSITKFHTNATHWNTNFFANLFHRLRNILARLDGIQRFPNFHASSFLLKLEDELLDSYNNLLKYKQDFWRTKSRISQLSDRDSNTSFFHTSIIYRRTRNKINELRDDSGNFITGEAAIHDHILSHFRYFFTSSYLSSPNIHFVPSNDSPTLFSNTIDVTYRAILNLIPHLLNYLKS